MAQLLAQLSSYELREWMAYEAKNGPLDNRWRDRMMAEMHYFSQWNNFLVGAQCSTKDKKNPVPEPQFAKRPWVSEESEAEPETDDE
ncbi:hypothetical protein [Streptomyces sp. NPDC002855]|uniref:hypothetical protein n=1 Tax=Streptomyces sp. NPDC002855 TaxID=3154437 RepID=UPI0033306738